MAAAARPAWTKQASLFAQAAATYWLRAYRQAQAEAAEWRRRAAQIPDAVLRTAALEALTVKREDLDGAVAYAAFASRATRLQLVRAIVSFQIAFDYLDTVAELPNRDPIANGRSLHRALATAVLPGPGDGDYYREQPHRDDAGYLEALVGACKAASGQLPSLTAVRWPLERSLARVAKYQSLCHGDANGNCSAFASWGRSLPAHAAGLHWWEAAAAAGSQLSVIALIAAAADTDTNPDEALTVERAYFPWIGAVSTLLDSALDWDEDRKRGQRNALDCYDSQQEASGRLRFIASQARDAIGRLARPERHAIVFAAMGAFFHARARAQGRGTQALTQAVLDAAGEWSTPARAAVKLHCATAAKHDRRAPLHEQPPKK